MKVIYGNHCVKLYPNKKESERGIILTESQILFLLNPKRAKINIKDEVVNSALVAVVSTFEVTLAELNSDTRLRHVAIARFAFFYLIKKYHSPRFSLSRIGKLLNRHHATVLHGLKKIQELQDIGDQVYVSLISNTELKFKQLISLEENPS